MKYNIASNEFLCSSQKSTENASKKLKGKEIQDPPHNMTDNQSHKKKSDDFDHDTVTSLPCFSGPKPNRVLHDISSRTCHFNNQNTNGIQINSQYQGNSLSHLTKEDNLQTPNEKETKLKPSYINHPCIPSLEDAIEAFTAAFCGFMCKQTKTTSNLSPNTAEKTNLLRVSSSFQKLKNTEVIFEERHDLQLERNEDANENTQTRDLIQGSTNLNANTVEKTNASSELFSFQKSKVNEVIFEERHDIQSERNEDANENTQTRDFIHDHQITEDRDNQNSSDRLIQEKDEKLRQIHYYSKHRGITPRTREVRGPLMSGPYRREKFNKSNKLVTRVKMGIMGIDSFGKPMPLSAITPKNTSRRKSTLNKIME